MKQPITPKEAAARGYVSITTPYKVLSETPLLNCVIADMEKSIPPANYVIVEDKPGHLSVSRHHSELRTYVTLKEGEKAKAVG